MRGKLNIRFLTLTAVIAVAFGVGWFFLNRYQKSRMTKEYLVQATRAEGEKKVDRAARLLRAYVLLAPNDADARVRYAETLEKLSDTKKTRADALGLYEQVLEQSPDRHETRRHAAELALKLGRVDTAFSHLEVLRKALPADAELPYLVGVCHDLKSHYAEAEKAYTEAWNANPTPQVAIRLASLYRGPLNRSGAGEERLERNKKADQVMNDLVKKVPNSFESYLVRGSYRRTIDPQNSLGEAANDAAKARDLAPDQLEVLLLSADVALKLAGQDQKHRDEQLDRARAHLTRGLEKHPHSPMTYLLLAKVESAAGRRDEAARVIRQARKQVPAAALPEVLLAAADDYAAAGDFAGAGEAVAELRKLNQPPARVETAAARLLARQGKWYEASTAFERVRPLVVDNPAKLLETDLQLATCYGRMGDLDRQKDVYARVVAANPTQPEPRVGLAEAYAALGRTGEAAAEYTRVTQMSGAPVGAYLALAGLKIRANLDRPEGATTAEWEEIDRLLDAAESASPTAIKIPILRAEMRVAQKGVKGVDEAKSLLATARAKRPEGGPDIWFALAALTNRGNDPAGAAAVLTEAEQKFGDSVGLRLARLRITPYQSADHYGSALGKLVAGTDNFSPDDRSRLMMAAAEGYWRIQNYAEAARLWADVARLRPADLPVRAFLFDATLQANDEPGMQAALKEIERIEGDGPLRKYGQAILLTWRAGPPRNARAGLGDARKLLIDAGSRRPGWARVPLALARIEELEGAPGRAVEAYKLAVQYGERQPPVLRRLVELLAERQQYADADQVLRRLEDQSPATGDLARLAAAVSLQLGTELDTARALELGRKAVPADSTDYRARVWLGQLLSAAGRADEAEAEFERAVSLGPDHPEPLVALVQFHVARKAPGKAEAAVHRAEGRLAGDRAPLALARCYELLGRRREAESKFQAAVQAAPGASRTLRAAAEFYQRGGAPEAGEKLLRQLLALGGKADVADTAWARRNLGLLVGLRGGDQSFGEALGLVEQNATAGETAEDLLTKAVLHASRPADRAKAVDLFERAEKLRPLSPDQEFILARLYEAGGGWPQAQERYRRLAGLPRANPTHVATLVDRLARRGDWSAADAWVGRLRQVAPHAAATVGSQVRVWLNRKRVADSMALVQEYAQATDGDPVDPVARFRVAAELMDQVSLGGAGDRAAAAAAEGYYARYVDAAKRPEAVLALASFYGRHGDAGKALTICERALRDCPVEQVAAAASDALAGEGDHAAYYPRVEAILKQALAAKPDLPDLRFRLAAVHEIQGAYASAEADYRAVLARNARHVGALNNLAILLALTGRADEAVARAQEAVATGPGVYLLDTRGLVYTAAGRLDDARKDLEAAAAEDPGLAAAHYHRAIVYQKQQDKPRAAAAFRMAKERGLRPSLLHPLEKAAYDALVTWVGNL